MDIATRILSLIEAGRLQKSVDGFVSGSYTITLTSASETELRGFVNNGDGAEYGVVISADRAFCSCKDAMHRARICKHQAALALYAIRHPQADSPKEKPAEQPVNVRLGKVRKGFGFSA